MTRTETGLLAACLAMTALAIAGPAVVQPADYHAFADQRSFIGLPHALDVLSNLPFAIAGLAGLAALLGAGRRGVANVERAMALLFFSGLLLVAGGSSWYHWQPDDAGLAVDRAGMGIAFAGLLGLATASRVSERAGAVVGLTVLLLAPLAINHCARHGDIFPWAVLQGGGMAAVVWVAMLRPRHGALDVRWGWVIVAYGVAKLLELHDHEIFELTGRFMSGHTLNHVAAAAAAMPVIAALRRVHRGQNVSGIQTTRSRAAHRAAALEEIQ